MSLIRLLKQIKPENILIDHFEGKAYTGYFRPIGIIFFLKKQDSEKEQIVSLLHELWHWHPKFYGKSLVKNENEKIEMEIETLAYDIYHNCPNIRNYIREKLRLAKQNQCNG